MSHKVSLVRWHFVNFFLLRSSHTVARNSLMSAKLRSLREVLAAFVAHKRPFSSVCSNVVVKGGGPGERTRTVAALKWLLAGVNDSMRAQLGWIREALRAVSALIRFLWSLVADVNLEHGSLWKGFPTLAAFPQAQLCDLAENGLAWFHRAVVLPILIRDGRGRVAGLAFRRWKWVRVIRHYLFLHRRGKVEGGGHFALKTVQWLATDSLGRG